MSFSSEDYCTVHRHSVVKARKQHTCNACLAVILPGHYYATVFTIFDGEPETVKRCGSCEQTWQHLFKLCQAHNIGNRSGDRLYPSETLNCGLKYEEEWGELPDEIAALPLLGADERGALLAPGAEP